MFICPSFVFLLQGLVFLRGPQPSCHPSRHAILVQLSILNLNSTGPAGTKAELQLSLEHLTRGLCHVPLLCTVWCFMGGARLPWDRLNDYLLRLKHDYLPRLNDLKPGSIWFVQS